MLFLSDSGMPLSRPGVEGVVFLVVLVVARERVQFLAAKVWPCSGFASRRFEVAVFSLGFLEWVLNF